MTQYVRAINIANNSIKSFVFDTNTSNTLNAAAVVSAVAISANVSAQAVNTFVTLQVQQLANTPPSINTISITDSSYNILDDTAANTGGAYLTITGTNFQSGAIVMVGSGNTALSTTFVDSNNLRAQIPAIAAGTYPVYVVNTNGGTAIRINGLTTSPFPAWSTGTTLTGQTSAISFAISLSANSDSNITYSNTTVLPAGSTLAANGLFSGTITVGATTTYSFTVRAIDAENQDASREFSVTVTPPPQYRLYSWGINGAGTLGQNDTANKSSPTQVGTGTNWNSISAGYLFMIATKTDGTLWTWGFNANGQLGTNDTANKSSPTQVGTGTDWNLVNTTVDYNCAAIKTNNTLWVWGRNNRGQFGQNNRSNVLSPIQVGTETNWSKISIAQSSLAIKTNGTLWSWGHNNFGQLGLNDSGVYRSSPVQIGTGTDWNQINVNNRTSAAIKTDGTLWTWGFNLHGQLGINNLNYKSSPTQVGTNTNWSLVSIWDYNSAAIKTDGTLWTWGRNQFGELGHNNLVYKSSPTQVGTGTNWSKVSANHNAFIATKTDGTLWGWGNNNSGQLGKNYTNPNTVSSPVQIGSGTNWSQISIGRFCSMAVTLN